MASVAFYHDVVPAFINQDAEYCFHKYQRVESFSIIQTACTCNIIFSLYLLYAEYNWNLISGEFWGFIYYRGIIALILVLWKYLLSLQAFREREYANLAMYTLYASIILIMHSIIASRQIDTSIDTDDYTFLFHAGHWSLGDAMLFICFCFNSGLLFAHSSGLGGAFTVLFTVLPFIMFYPEHKSSLNSFSVVIIPCFYFMFLTSAHDVEIKLRHRFMRLSDLGHDLRRQDTLIHSILPPDISIALKKGDVQKLATYHRNVTVLFCSIVGFGEQSSSSHAEDIVKLLIRIVTMFDRIVDHMGVYKVENIADTYLCCDGLELSKDAHKDHVMRIARTALAMREAADYFQWRWSDGSPVQLKIGIHSGPVSGGVIGTKSFSYHLFGDTVNTASRMCSCSISGQICISRDTMKQIRDFNKGIFLLRSRGKVNVKGKGEMSLFWLDGYKHHQNSETPAQIYGIDTRKDLSDSIGRFFETAANDSVISIRKFDLSYYSSSYASSDEDDKSTAISRRFSEWYYAYTSASFRYNVSRTRRAVSRLWQLYGGCADRPEIGSDSASSNSVKSWLGNMPPCNPPYKVSRSPSKVEPVTMEELHSIDRIDSRPNRGSTSTDTATKISTLSSMSSRMSSGDMWDHHHDDSHCSSDYHGGMMRLSSSDRSYGARDSNLGRDSSMFTIFSEMNEAIEDDVISGSNTPPQQLQVQTPSLVNPISEANIMETAAQSLLIESCESCESDDFSPKTQEELQRQFRVTSPVNTPQGSSANKTFRRSLSDSAHDGASSPRHPLNQRKTKFADTPRARSFDESDKFPAEMSAGKLDTDERKRLGSRSGSMVSVHVRDFLTRGSVSLANIFLSRNHSKADSFMSSSTETGAKDEEEEDDNNKYDALVDRSGHHRPLLSRSISSDHLTTNADLMERQFREENDRDNVDQFRRVLITLTMIYAVHALIDFQMLVLHCFSLGALLIVLFYMHIFRDAYKRLQSAGILVTLLLVGCFWYTAFENHIISLLEVILFAFALINIHLRLRFVIAFCVSTGMLVGMFLSLFLSVDLPVWACGFLAYCTVMVGLTLAQVYAKESRIREDFKHLQILKLDSQKSRLLIENMVPQPAHAKQLLRGELVFDELHNVTLLYSDIRGFTPLSAKMKPQALCKLLNLIYSAFDRHLEHFGLYKIDTIGDAFIVAGGLPGHKSVHNHAMACVQFALHMLNDIRVIRESCDVDLEMRIGIHSGSVLGSVISLNKPRYLIWGATTETANAMESTAVPGTIHISSETATLLDAEEMSFMNISLEKRAFDSNVATHTSASYEVKCPDLHPFFHDTWSIVNHREVFDAVRTGDHGMRGAMETIANRVRNSFRVSPVFSPTESASNLEFDEMTVTTPNKKRSSFFDDEVAYNSGSVDENSVDGTLSLERSTSSGRMFFRDAARKVMLMNSTTSVWRKPIDSPDYTMQELPSNCPSHTYGHGHGDNGLSFREKDSLALGMVETSPAFSTSFVPVKIRWKKETGKLYNDLLSTSVESTLS